MKLEAGKYYKTRDGRKVGPIYESNGEWVCNDHIEDCKPMWNIKNGVANFISAGLESDMPKFDLIAEWTDEPAKDKPTAILSTETIDHIAIDSLKFHFKDQDMEPLQLEAFRIVLRYYGVTV